MLTYEAPTPLLIGSPIDTDRHQPIHPTVHHSNSPNCRKRPSLTCWVKQLVRPISCSSRELRRASHKGSYQASDNKPFGPRGDQLGKTGIGTIGLAKAIIFGSEFHAGFLCHDASTDGNPCEPSCPLSSYAPKKILPLCSVARHKRLSPQQQLLLRERQAGQLIGPYWTRSQSPLSPAERSALRGLSSSAFRRSGQHGRSPRSRLDAIHACLPTAA